MSNGSLKDQLSAVASQFCDPSKKNEKRDHQSQQSHQQHHQHKAKHAAAKPAAKPQKPKPRWLEYAQYGVDLLKVYFPECFKSMSEVKPLKKGIKEDLLKRLSTLENIVTEDKACMVKSLSYYVNTQSYHKCVSAGAIRVGLDGEEAGVVTAEEAKYSVDKQQARLQAKQQAATGAVSQKTEEQTEPA